MLLFVFGTLSFIIGIEKKLTQNNYDFLLQNTNKAKKIFVKIERIQNKSFFGFYHHYFTLSFWEEGKKIYVLKKVTSSLYYKYKEGNQIEALLIKDQWNNPQIFLMSQLLEEIQLEKIKYKNLEEISNIFLGLGLILIFYFFLIQKNKNAPYEA